MLNLPTFYDFQVFSWNVNGLNQKFGEFLAFFRVFAISKASLFATMSVTDNVLLPSHTGAGWLVI